MQSATPRKGGTRECQPGKPADLLYIKGGEAMRFIFVYTNSESPRVDVVKGVTSITSATVNDVVTIHVFYTDSGTTGEKVFYLTEGLPAISWDVVE